MAEEVNKHGPYGMECKILDTGTTRTVGQNGFQVRDFIVEEIKESKYPNTVKFTLKKDYCDLMDEFKVGDRVLVKFFVNGRKWTDKKGVDQYFNSLDAFKVESLSGEGSSDVPPPAEPPDDISAADDGDIPF